MKKDLTANEAREISVKNAPDMSDIMEKIKDEAGKGHFALTLKREPSKDIFREPQLSDEEIQYLLYLGYDIQVLNNHYTIIIWGKEK